MATKKVRILVATTVDGKAYRCNQVVELDAVQAKTLVKAGVADDADDAVKFAVETLKAVPVLHAVPAAEEEKPE